MELLVTIVKGLKAVNCCTKSFLLDVYGLLDLQLCPVVVCMPEKKLGTIEQILAF